VDRSIKKAKSGILSFYTSSSCKRSAAMGLLVFESRVSIKTADGDGAVVILCLLLLLLSFAFLVHVLFRDEFSLCATSTGVEKITQ